MNKNWIDLLCKYGNTKDFEDILQGKECIPIAIMTYRKLLKKQRLCEIPFGELKIAYMQKEYDILCDLLQQLFLEPIPQSQFEFILDRINMTESGLEKVHNEHKKDMSKRILTIILAL